jgi:uncharacterized NAD(P)/FAD-binding protein YdhS
MSSFSEPFDVAIVGTGASGTLVAAQFKRIAPHGRLAIIGNDARPGRGIAYGTKFESHLLNVPAGNMSAFPHDMEHFTRWVKFRRPHSSAASFVKRGLYGDYLAEIFYSVISDLKNTQHIVETVDNLSREDDIWNVHLSDGTSLQAYKVVLAIGNLLPPADPIDFSSVDLNYRRNPWASDSITDIHPTAPVLLIGSGLTTIDVALSLRETGHQGTIHVISRHGRLYQAHQYHETSPLFNLPKDFKSPASALRWIRKKIEISKSLGIDWRSVIDSLRPYTASIWQSWSLRQQKSFLRHARNLWDVHRHRMAPKIWNQLGILIEDRILQLHCGYLLTARSDGDDAVITWKEPDTDQLQHVTVSRIINCTGPSRDYSKIHSSLITELRTKGWIVPDELKLGFETDADGRFVNCNSEPVDGLFTIGPTRIPALWESIAIPEIRNQALALAKIIISETIEAAALPA